MSKRKNGYLAAAWVLAILGLLTLPQLVLEPGVLLFAAYAFYNLYRRP